MKVLTWIAKKVLPKKLITKFVNKQIAKATKVDCGIFAQAANRQGSAQGIIKDFINHSGYTTISFNDLSKKC